MGVQTETKTKNTYKDIKDMEDDRRRAIRRSMRLKLKATSMEREAKVANDAAKLAMLDVLEDMPDRIGLLDFELGKIIMAENSRSTLDKPQLKDLLVKAGLEPEVVGRLFKECTNVSVSVYPRFYPANNGV